MSSPDYTTLAIERDKRVATVTLDHPPMNLLDLALMTDLERLGRELEADTETRAVVFQSANPDYFIAHADVALIQRLPSEVPPKSEELSFFHQMVERYRTLPCATIAAIEGRARGGGSEFTLSLDMRFGAIGRCIVSQPEVALGILPGGSGTQRLPRLVGRGRALEAILGCEDFDANLAERYGWINRALPAAELRPFVYALAQRIASFPARRSRSPSARSTPRTQPCARACSRRRTCSAARSPAPRRASAWTRSSRAGARTRSPSAISARCSGA